MGIEKVADAVASQEFHSSPNPNPPRLMYKRGVIICSASTSADSSQYAYSTKSTGGRATNRNRKPSTTTSTSTNSSNISEHGSNNLNTNSANSFSHNTNNNTNYNRRLSSVNDSSSNIKGIISNAYPTASVVGSVVRQGSFRRRDSSSSSAGGVKKTVAFSTASTSTAVGQNTSSSANANRRTSVDTNLAIARRTSSVSSSLSSSSYSSPVNAQSSQQQHRRGSNCSSRSETISSNRGGSGSVVDHQSHHHQSYSGSDQVTSTVVNSPRTLTNSSSCSSNNNNKQPTASYSYNNRRSSDSVYSHQSSDQADSSWSASDSRSSSPSSTVERQEELRLMAQQQYSNYTNNPTTNGHINHSNTNTNTNTNTNSNNPHKYPNNVNMNNNNNQNHGGGGRKEFVPSFVLVDAAKANNEKKIRELVKRLQPLCSEDVDPVVNFQDSCGRTALSYACAVGNYNMVDELSKLRRIDPNRSDNENNSPIHYACQAGHSDVVDLLLTRFEGNVDLNARNSTGLTPLMKAALQGRTRCCKSLISAGAQAHLRDYSRGYSAADWAKLCGRHICAEVILRCAKDNYQTLDSPTTNYGRHRPLPVSQSALELKRITSEESSPYYHLYAARNTISGATWLKNKIKKALGSSSSVNNSTSSKSSSQNNFQSDNNFALFSNVTVPGLCASSLLLPSIKPLIEQQKPLRNQIRKDNFRMTIPTVQVTHVNTNANNKR